MNTYRKTGKILSIFLLVVFIFAATQPTRASSPYGSSHATYQSHLENLAITVVPQWQTAFFHIKSPLLGTTWQHCVTQPITTAYVDAFNINVHEFLYFFTTPTINAP